MKIRKAIPGIKRFQEVERLTAERDRLREEIETLKTDIDADNTAYFLRHSEEEWRKLREAVTEIADKGYVVTGEDARDMVQIAKAALAGKGAPQSDATHYECPECGCAVPHGMKCHHNL